MSEAGWVAIGLFVLGGVFSVMFWLLRGKDARQERDIGLLWDKHDKLQSKHEDLRNQLAARHYERNELDSKFDKLEVAFKDGFVGLGNKFDNLAKALMDHIVREENRL